MFMHIEGHVFVEGIGELAACLESVLLWEMILGHYSGTCSGEILRAADEAWH